jgi:excisionase family DNA binding protein
VTRKLSPQRRQTPSPLANPLRLPPTQPLGMLSAAVARRALTLEEAGQVAGVTKAVIRQEIERGRLAAFRVGYRRIRISVNALNEYLRARASEGV